MYFRTAIEVISSSLLMYFHKTAFCITIIMQIINFISTSFRKNNVSKCWLEKQRNKQKLTYVILNNRKSYMMVFISMFAVNNFIQGPK